MGPYEIVGNDVMGAIGANLLIGASDDDILEALISGAGTSEIIGDAGGSAADAPSRQAQIQNILKKGAGAVIQNQLNRRRRFPIGFAVTSVGAGVNANIPAAPQNLFRGERPVIPSDIAFDFGVTDVKVGNQSQFAQQSEVPAVVFSEVSIDTQMTFDTAEVGNQLSMAVRNKTAGAVEFTGAVMGTIAKAG